MHMKKIQPTFSRLRDFNLVTIDFNINKTHYSGRNFKC